MAKRLSCRAYAVEREPQTVPRMTDKAIHLMYARCSVRQSESAPPSPHTRPDPRTPLIDSWTVLEVSQLSQLVIALFPANAVNCELCGLGWRLNA